MGYFQIRYDSRGINYDRRGFIRLATGCLVGHKVFNLGQNWPVKCKTNLHHEQLHSEIGASLYVPYLVC